LKAGREWSIAQCRMKGSVTPVASDDLSGSNFFSGRAISLSASSKRILFPDLHLRRRRELNYDFICISRPFHFFSLHASRVTECRHASVSHAYVVG